MKCLIVAIWLLIPVVARTQEKETLLSLYANRYYQYKDETGKQKTFGLCEQSLYADSSRFFTLLDGCEARVMVGLARYRFARDTFFLTPFDYLREKVFLRISKTPSSHHIQTITFLSIDEQQMRGATDSWWVRCMRKRTSTLLDFSARPAVTFKRGRYDCIELLQLTKIFGHPIVLFVDKQFDYKVIVNLPKEAMEVFVKGVFGLQGQVIAGDTALYLPKAKPEDNFKIWTDSRRK